MSNLQKKEKTIDLEIINEVIDIIPENWTSALLRVQCISGNSDEAYTHIIESPEGYRDYVEPSAKLFQATRKLVLLFYKYGHSWRQVEYNLVMQSNQTWKFTVTFQY